MDPYLCSPFTVPPQTQPDILFFHDPSHALHMQLKIPISIKGSSNTEESSTLTNKQTFRPAESHRQESSFPKMVG